MLSTCPECQTRFRITQAQLDARRGMVRCGRCNAVFNAYDTLLPELQTPPVAEPERSPEEVPPPPAEETAAAMARIEVEAQAEKSGQPTQERPSAPPAGASVQPPPAEPARDSAEAILLTELFKPEKRSASGHAWLWGTVGFLLLLTLGGQLIYFFRADLAARLPQTHPWLEESCRVLGCRIPLPQDVAALRIESSSLETDPENRSHAILRLSLSNRSRQTVAWPHLILLLTDVSDTPLAQRPFMPVEYLPPGNDPALGIRPEQEQEINLELEIRGLSAYGYRMEMRYP